MINTLADYKLTQQAVEDAYRRGFNHGVEAMAEIEDIWEDEPERVYHSPTLLAAQMRFDGEPHGRYMQEFIRKVFDVD